MLFLLHLKKSVSSTINKILIGKKNVWKKNEKKILLKFMFLFIMVFDKKYDDKASLKVAVFDKITKNTDASKNID